MALIKCPECGKEISNRAERCINCGFPIAVSEENKADTGQTEPIPEVNADNSLSGQNDSSKRKKAIIIAAIAIALIALVIIIVSVNSGNKKSGSYSSGSKYYSDTYSTSMDHDTYCMIYLNISDVKVKHSGNYAYITGTIKNTGTYQVKFVKVRAACKDWSGKIIDTDWTYAVDSSWLNPGESKTFEMMVKDEDKKISTATVTIQYD